MNKRVCKRWMPDDLVAVKELFRSGNSIEQIAHQIGRTSIAVYQKTCELHVREKKTTLERIMSRVDTSSGCWEWTGTRLPAGYGRISVNGRHTYVHRLMWDLTHGAIPNGMFVCHQCDNPRCVNPDHLFVATQKDNLADMRTKERHPWHGKRGDESLLRQRPECILRGENNSMAKLSNIQVREMRRLFMTGTQTQRQLSRMFRINEGTVSLIVRGLAWVSVT